MLPALIVALFLVAHAAIHASFIAPRPAATAAGPQWPFDLGRSWALSPLGLGAGATRTIGMGLLIVVLASYGAAALSVSGLVSPALFVVAVVAGSIASLVMLALFFHPWLLLGFVIDAVLLWATLVAGWRPGTPGLS